MSFTRSLAVFAAIGLSWLTAHAQFQVVHDAPNTTSNPKLIPLLLADGSTVTYHTDAGNDVFRKYDANGALVWNKALAGNSLNSSNGDPAIVLMNDGADGFRFVRLVGIGVTINDSIPNEYLFNDSTQVVHVNGIGDVTDAFAVKRTSIEQCFCYYDNISEFDAAPTPGGGMVLAMTFREAASGVTEMMKINAAGALEWSRSIYSLGNEPRARVAVSATGRTYYMEGSIFSYGDVRLAELNSSGHLLWMRRYIYGNTSPVTSFNDIQTDDAGNVHIAGYMTSSVGNFHIFLRTDADGVLNRGDLYRTPWGMRSNGFGVDGDGRRYHLVNPVNPLSPTYSQGLLIADTLGSSAQFIRRDDQVVLPNNVFIVPNSMDVSGDRLAISGLLNHEDVDLAYTTRYETLTSIGTDSIYSCLMNDTTFADIQIPMSIMTTEDVSNAASIDVSAYYSSEPLTLSFTSLAADPLEPLCTFAVELLQAPLGVGEGSSTPPSPLVLNTLVPQGTPLVMNDPQAKAVDVYDSYGALVQRSNSGAGQTVSTTGWATGIYLLRAIDSRGTPFRTQRIVVE